MAEIRKLSRNVYTLRVGPAAGAVVSFGNTAADVAFAAASGGSGSGGGAKGQWVPWGDKDEKLSQMHKLACESPNKWRLLFTRADFNVADGLVTKERKVVNGKTVVEEVLEEKLEELRERLNLDWYVMDAAAQLAFSYNIFVKITLASASQVESLEVLDCFDVRVVKPLPGSSRIEKYVLNSNFGRKGFKKDESIELPAFDPREPAKYPVSIIHVRRPIPGQKFYSFGDWWGTELVTQVANKVPKFDNAGLDNGYNLKYHIAIPDNYFEKEALSEEEQEKLKEEVLEKMGDSLAGVENVDKVIFTFDPIGNDGKPIPGVRITPLKNEMSDTAYNDKFKTYNAAAAGGHGVLPVLAGIDTGSKMGGSGKELEAAANYVQGFLTPTDRKLILLPVRYAMNVEGFLLTQFFDFANIQLYTYDVTPSGTKANPNEDKPNVPPQTEED